MSAGATNPQRMDEIRHGRNLRTVGELVIALCATDLGSRVMRDHPERRIRLEVLPGLVRIVEEPDAPE